MRLLCLFLDHDWSGPPLLGAHTIFVRCERCPLIVRIDRREVERMIDEERGRK